MAVRIVKYRVDDRELQEDPRAEVRADQTVKFALNDTEYEIDLTKANSDQLVSDFGPWIKAARRVGHGRRLRRRAAPGKPTVREWAVSNGYDVKPQGRVPDRIVAEYEAAVS